jgi:hypothetical protein
MFHYRFQVNRSIHRWQAKAVGGTHLVSYSRAFYKRFARDTPRPRAVTADAVFFDKGNPRAELHCKWGSYQPCGTTANYGQIICIFHASPPVSVIGLF